MIDVQFNGEPLQLASGLTVAALLDQRGLTERRVAVERNGEIVPRSQHPHVQLQPGDRIEVVMAIGGG